jgi:hypothetical protein
MLGERTMKRLILVATIPVLLLPLATLAQDKTIEPSQLTIAAKRPLQLDERQKNVIQDALVQENTEQKSPPNFAAKVGEPLPISLKVDVMPQRLVQREPSLEPYGYAKLAKEVLVLDPLKKTIVAILPRAEPGDGKSPSPTDWAATQGRTLTGQAPLPDSGADKPMQPAGDSGDVKNGNESKANSQ